MTITYPWHDFSKICLAHPKLFEGLIHVIWAIAGFFRYDVYRNEKGPATQ
jgi:hypothetical protein